MITVVQLVKKSPLATTMENCTKMEISGQAITTHVFTVVVEIKQSVVLKKIAQWCHAKK